MSTNLDYIPCTNTVVVDDRRSVYEALIRLFSVLEFETKRKDKLITPDEATMLSFYLLEGITEKARTRAKDFFGKNRSKVDELTLRLRRNGYLIVHEAFQRDKAIVPTLLEWKNAYDESVRTNKPLVLAIKIQEKAYANIAPKKNIKVSKSQ